MIEILTLLHGLVVGPIELHLRVPPEVAKVEIRYAGEMLVEHEGPPWQVQVPFPDQPSPSRLAITGFDAEGQAVGRLDRLVNLDWDACTPPEGHAIGDVSPLLIETSPEALSTGARPPGAAAADSRALAELLEGRVSGHGGAIRVLAVEQGPAEVLVVQDPAIQDLLDRVSLLYFESRPGEYSNRPNDSDSVALLRGALASLEDGTASRPTPPTAEPLADSLAEPAPRVARSTTEGMRSPRERVRERNQKRRTERRAESVWAELASFDVDGTIRFVWPAGPPVARLERETVVFPLIGPFDPGFDGLLWHIQTSAGITQSQRVSDAVAVAGYQAAATCRRRAVLLMEVHETDDASLLRHAATRRYLDSVQVPFFSLRNRPHNPSNTWDAENSKRLLADSAGAGEDGDPWGDSDFLVGHDRRLRLPQTGAALETFRQRAEDSLERQWVVWLEGRHLPSEVTVKAPGITVSGAGAREAGR